MVGCCSLIVWPVYRLYHKVHSAGWGNVCCSHCDWREQPPLLIPLVLLHDISGKDIPPLVKPSLVLSLFSVHPALLTLAFPNFCPSFLFFPIALSHLFPSSLNIPSSILSLSLSSTPLPSNLPYKHGRIWVCGKGLECVVG